VLLLKRESSYRIFLSGKCMVFCCIMLGMGVPDRSVPYIYIYIYSIYVYSIYVYED